MNEVPTPAHLGQEEMVKFCLMIILFDTLRSSRQGICLGAKDDTSLQNYQYLILWYFSSPVECWE